MSRTRNARAAATATTSRKARDRGDSMPTIAVMRICSPRRNATTAPSMASHRNKIEASQCRCDGLAAVASGAKPPAWAMGLGQLAGEFLELGPGLLAVLGLPVLVEARLCQRLPEGLPVDLEELNPLRAQV